MALFTLEALDAKRGDCLILHYGSEKDPRFLLIDGGPGGVYADRLRPRLAAIRKKWSRKAPLPLQMVMVSHIDDDHINGILDLTEDLLRHPGDPSCEILSLWHNSFDDLLGNAAEDLFSRLARKAAPAALGMEPPSAGLSHRSTAAVAASVGQGRKLRSNAELLSLAVNAPFQGLVLSTTAEGTAIDFGDGLMLTVLGPSRPRVEALQKDWEKEIAKGMPSEAKAAEYVDDSVYNLSSLVVLAELGGKSILLTGDARGDDILAAVNSAKLLKNGSLHVDVLKLPHHGSDRNVAAGFFTTIVADSYVVSGDGDFGNPEIETLKMLSGARPDDAFTLYLTNHDGKEDLRKKLDKFFAAEKKAKRKYKVVYRRSTAPSLKIDLLQPVKY